MVDRRAAAALIVAAWLVESAYAQQAISRPAPAPRPDAEDSAGESRDWPERVDAARQRHRDWLACVAAKARGCSSAAAQDPMESLLNDETLVKGDIVSTPMGLKVFRGQPNAPHSLADFE